MSDRRDPFDLFAAARPFDPPLDPNVDVDAEATLQRILATPPEPAKPIGNRRRARRGVALGIAVAAISGGTVAAIVLTRDRPSELTSLSCWSDATSPSPAEAVVVPWSGEDPVGVCIAVWQQNGFESLDTNEAPPLVACVNEGGAIAVIPGDDSTCSAVGLPNYDDLLDPAVDQTRSAIEQIEAAVNGTDCVTSADAAATVEQILDDNDLGAWTVVTPDVVGASTTCMTAAIDPQGLQVFLVPGADNTE